MINPYPSGTIYTYNLLEPDIIVDVSKRLPVPAIKMNGDFLINKAVFSGCFDPFWGYFKKADKFYFCFPLMPEWAEEIVTEFNSKFKNIGIRLVSNTKVYGEQTSNSYGEWILKVGREKTDDTKYTFSVPVFKVEFKEEYSSTIHANITYLIHHYLRMYSLTEKFLSLTDNKPDNFLEFACKELNNNRRKNQQYTRCISDEDIQESDLLRLDKLEIVNYISAHRLSLGKQTSTLANFKKVGIKLESIAKNDLLKKESSVVYSFRRGDFCKIKPEYNDVYRITNSDMLLAEVVSIPSYGSMSIKVLQHTTLPEEIGSIYSVDSIYFYRVYSNGSKAKLRTTDKVKPI